MHELRKQVGNAPLIMVGAAVLIVNHQNELLMLLRTDNGCWGIPGGAMEPGESLEETARRETFEETGLTIQSLYLLDVFSGPELFYRYPDGNQVYNVTAGYLALGVSGEILIGKEEHSRWRYFPLDDLPGNVSPPIKPVLARLVKSRTSTTNINKEREP